jgi:dipeptidyl aminopeptidase/acylaminoacyl peptidase
VARVLEIEALFRQQAPSDPRWSPDGRWLVFALGFTDVERDAGGSALWMMVSDGTEQRPLTRGRKPDGAPAHDSHPRWSPDGSCVAFLSDRGGERGIWLIPAFGGEAVPLTGAETGCGPIMADAFFAGLEWSPDGEHLAFAAQEPAPPGTETSEPAAEIDYGETYGHVRSRIQIWLLDVGDGVARRLTEGDWDCGDPRWTSDGGSILFVSNRSGDEGPVAASMCKNYDLWLIPAEGGTARALTENPGPDFCPRPSPDGRWIAFLAGRRCGPHRDHHFLCVLDRETGAVRELTGESDPVPDVLAAQCWSADSVSIFFSGWRGMESHLYRVAREGGAAEALTEGRVLRGAPALAPAGEVLACVAQGPRALPEIEIRRCGGTMGEGVVAATSFNGWLAEYALGAVEVVTWESDGLAIEGVRVTPPGYEAGKRYPALLFSHGGPHSRVTCGLHLEWFWQFLAAQGYVVLAPNFRGSAGYGREFLDANREDWGGGDFRDMMRGVDVLVAEGIADPERLGIFGGSYGGYMTCWTIANTERFRAAVARAPITDLVSYFGTTDLKTLTGWDLGGPPWERPPLYRERSPVTHVTRVRTPLLLLHGEADRRVPITQGEEFHTALKLLGVPVTFVRYPEAGHLIARPSHVRDACERTMAWFARYLGT